MAPSLEPTIAGAVLATAAVAAGAPLFNEGLRSLRLARAFARLEDRPLGGHPSGFARVRGRVVLESPLFAPLTGAPCAGFELVVLRADGSVAAVVDERRPFRLSSDGVGARVEAGRRRWRLADRERRVLRPDEPPTQLLEALLARAPEAQRLRRAGATLVLVERALLPGAECHVVGQVRHSRPFELAPDVEVAVEERRPGTDDAPVARGATGASAPAATPELWIDEGGALDYLLVSDAPIGRPKLAWSGVRALGLAAGPLLSLGGLLYLAHAADRLRELGRF